MTNKFVNEIRKLKDVKIKENIKITSTIKISTIFKYKIIIYKMHMVKSVMKIVNEYKVDYYTLGNCSNVLFMKDFYDGALIEVRFKSSNISILGAYELLGKVNSNYVKQGISSLLFLTLVPSSVGGAICMNAGAYNKEMKDVIEWVYFYDFDENKIKVYDNKSCQFSYRNSYFKNHRSIILGCKIKLEYLEKNLILNNMKDMIEIRKNKLPYEWPSLGSVFKNLDSESAGKIIDECGLKGVRVGGAMVSYKHANVIVNIGHCNREDIIRLIGLIREKVYKKYHKRLELEIILYE